MVYFRLLEYSVQELFAEPLTKMTIQSIKPRDEKTELSLSRVVPCSRTQHLKDFRKEFEAQPYIQYETLF